MRYFKYHWAQLEKIMEWTWSWIGDWYRERQGPDMHNLRPFFRFLSIFFFIHSVLCFLNHLLVFFFSFFCFFSFVHCLFVVWPYCAIHTMGRSIEVYVIENDYKQIYWNRNNDDICKCICTMHIYNYVWSNNDNDDSNNKNSFQCECMCLIKF